MNNLIYQLEITLLTYYFLRSVWRVGRCDRLVTLSASPLPKLPRISHIHSFLMSLIWMLGWNWERIFDVECELLFDDFKWFLCDFTDEDLYQECVDIFLSLFKSDNSLVIVSDRKWIVWCSFKFLYFLVVPIPSLRFHLLLCHREIFLSDCFIIPKRREFMGEEFSPLPCALHVVYDFPAE